LQIARALQHVGQQRPAQVEPVDVTPEAQAELDAILAAGKGAIVITGHVGNWELFFRRFVAAGYDARAVGKEQNDPRLTAWMERLRGPGRTIWRGAPGAARQLLKTLRGNGVLAMLIDQDTKVQGVFVPFFGDLAWTPRAAADLSLRTGAGVAAMFAHRKPGGGHVVSGRRVAYASTGDLEADVVGLTAAMTRAIAPEERRAALLLGVARVTLAARERGIPLADAVQAAIAAHGDRLDVATRQALDSAAREIRQLAVIGAEHPRLQLQLLHRVGHPALAEAFPGEAGDRAGAEHGPHRQLEGAGIRARDDADAAEPGDNIYVQGKVQDYKGQREIAATAITVE
jgi:hypothetical protein